MKKIEMMNREEVKVAYRNTLEVIQTSNVIDESLNEMLTDLVFRARDLGMTKEELTTENEEIKEEIKNEISFKKVYAKSTNAFTGKKERFVKGYECIGVDVAERFRIKIDCNLEKGKLIKKYIIIIDTVDYLEFDKLKYAKRCIIDLYDFYERNGNNREYRYYNK